MHAGSCFSDHVSILLFLCVPSCFRVGFSLVHAFLTFWNSISNGGVRSRLHLTVYIHATPETRLARRMARDQAERSLEPDMIQYQWDRHVRPGDRAYLEPVADLADVLVDNDRSGAVDLAHVHNAIDALIH